MPLNSLQQYCLGVVNGLTVPGTGVTIEAFITPPTVTNLDNPIAVVEGARLVGRRQTAPRTKGFKHLQWVVDIFLGYLTNPNSATVDAEFAQIIDAVMAAFWTIPMQALFLDANGNVVTPGTAGSSQILSIGEDFELDCTPEKVPQSLRMLYYCARLGLDVYEAVQA